MISVNVQRKIIINVALEAALSLNETGKSIFIEL